MSNFDQSLPEVIVQELRHRDDQCIRVGGYGYAYPFLRYHADAEEWRWAHYEEYGRVEGRVLDECQVVEIVESHSFHLLHVENAIGGLTDDGPTVWEDADEQDVFRDFDRCFWCGGSERQLELQRYETTEDGECSLCSDCHESYDDCDQIVREIPEEATA